MHEVLREGRDHLTLSTRTRAMNLLKRGEEGEDWFENFREVVSGYRSMAQRYCQGWEVK